MPACSYFWSLSIEICSFFSIFCLMVGSAISIFYHLRIFNKNVCISSKVSLINKVHNKLLTAFRNFIMIKNIIVVYEKFFNIFQRLFLFCLVRSVFNFFFISASVEVSRSTLFISNSVFINFSSSMIACFLLSTSVSRFGSLYIFSSTSLSLYLFEDA